MRQHLAEQSGEIRNVIVTMMQVVNDAHIRKLELLDDGQLIFRFAEPAAVIIQCDAATLLRRGFRNRANASRFLKDTLRLLF